MCPTVNTGWKTKEYSRCRGRLNCNWWLSITFLIISVLVTGSVNLFIEKRKCCTWFWNAFCWIQIIGYVVTGFDDNSQFSLLQMESFDLIESAWSDDTVDDHQRSQMIEICFRLLEVMIGYYGVLGLNVGSDWVWTCCVIVLLVFMSNF